MSEREEAIGTIAYFIDKYCTGGGENDFKAAEAAFDALDWDQERADLMAEIRVLKDEREESRGALNALVNAATSVAFPDGDHGAEQSALAQALRQARDTPDG